MYCIISSLYAQYHILQYHMLQYHIDNMAITNFSFCVYFRCKVNAKGKSKLAALYKNPLSLDASLTEIL